MPATSKNNDLKTLRVVVFREDGMYIGQCLEHDIAAQAADIDSLLDRLDLTVEAECEFARERGEEPLVGIAPAPNYFRDLWEKGSVSLTRLNMEVDHHLQFEAKLAKAA